MTADQLDLTTSDGSVHADMTCTAKDTPNGASTPGAPAGPSDHTSPVEGDNAPAVGGVGPRTPPPAHTLVIGLDLSLTATGMSDGTGTWLVRSTGHRGDTLTTRQLRLHQLASSIVEQIDGLTDLVVIEGPSLGQARQSGVHDRSGLWWLVVDRLLDEGHQVVEVPPAALKKYATGKGNANKGAVIDATARRFPNVETGADDNRCDALWLAAMGLDHLTGSGVVPAAQRDGLAKVAWPTGRCAS